VVFLLVFSLLVSESLYKVLTKLTKADGDDAAGQRTRSAMKPAITDRVEAEPIMRSSNVSKHSILAIMLLKISTGDSGPRSFSLRLIHSAPHPDIIRFFTRADDIRASGLPNC
jgi:hypothetical protein